MDTQALAVMSLNLKQDALAGQVAVVTGAGRGIGREVARALAWLGARVVIATRSDNGLKTQSLVREAGGEAFFLRTDVGSEEDIEQLGREVRSRFGPVDILVNNAIYSPVRSVQEMTASEFEQVLAVNLIGAFRTCKQFLPEMLARKRGAIINMISTEAFPYLSAYIASKQGLAAFSQSLAAEVGHQGVSVVAFAPGFVDTPGLTAVAGELAPRIGTRQERFLSLSFHKAYPRAMPADHSGAATAYLIAALLKEYHGEVVDVYKVLERAGFLGPGSVEEPEARVTAPQLAVRESDLAPDLSQARTLCTRLEAILTETEAEFNRLPLTFRPLARSGFKAKTGQGVVQWQRTVATLAVTLGEGGGGPSELAEFLRTDYPPLKARFQQLLRYYEDVPAQLANFTNNQSALERARRTMSDRVAVLSSLFGELEHLMPSS